MKNLKNHFKTVFILVMLSMMSLGVNAQSVIKGTVTDGNGEPIIGATVKEAGTSNGVVTDINGQFTITPKANSKLNISYVGFATTTVDARGKSNLTVALKQDAKVLEDVVVIG